MDLTFDDPCLVFALRREAVPFLRLFPPQERFPGSPCWARFCGPAWLSVLVLQSGPGPLLVEQAANWVLGKPLLGNVPYRPKLLLSVGFCGALLERRQVGDVVLATEIIGQDEQCLPVTWPTTLPTGKWNPPLHRERLLTMPQLASTVADKQALANRYGAAAIDMESAFLARLCGLQGIPFGCVRVVADDAHTPLSPRLLSCLSGGRVSPVRFLTTLLRSPGLGREMWQQAQNTRQAANQLSRALGELLTLTLEW
jgi:hypothetical protein